MERDPVLTLCLGYSQAFVGDNRRAAETLEKYMRRAITSGDRRPFVVANSKREEAFLDLLRSKPDRVFEYLAEVEDHVAQALGLDDLRMNAPSSDSDRRGK